jgi:hypothetical protein
LPQNPFRNDEYKSFDQYFPDPTTTKIGKKLPNLGSIIESLTVLILCHHAQEQRNGGPFLLPGISLTFRQH